MADKFELDISTPDKMFFSDEVESLVITTADGEMGILPHHVLMVVALETAPIRFTTEDGQRIAALSGGFAQIKGNKVVILADSAEWPEEIDENRALEAKRKAEERLQTDLSEREYVRSKVALRRAMTRLRVKQHK